MEATHYPARHISHEHSNRLAQEAVHSREALARLYAAHAPHLFRYFWIHTYSRALAEDLVSETFLAVLHTIEGYRADRGSFSAWLYGIARHTLAHHAAQAAPLQGVQSLDVAPPLEDVRERLAPRLDERIDLWEAVLRLGEFDREIIALRFGAGFSHHEIAELTGQGNSYVRVTLRRALHKLRARLTGEEGFDAQ